MIECFRSGDQADARVVRPYVYWGAVRNEELGVRKRLWLFQNLIENNLEL